MEYKKASELMKVADKRYDEKVAAAKTTLEEACLEAINKMIAEGDYQTELVIKDDMSLGMEHITEKLREHEFKYCLVQQVNEEEEVLETRLRISMAHLF